MKKAGVLILLILSGIFILYLFYTFFNSSQNILSGNAILASVKCIDSDGGDKPNSKGVISYRWNNYIDYCYERGTKLMEYYCFNGMKGKSYTCQYRCKNGACVIKAVLSQVHNLT